MRTQPEGTRFYWATAANPGHRCPGAALLAVCLAAGALLVAGSASAQNPSAYPTKPIRIIIPFVVGGPTDILTRVIGQKLTEKLGQQVLADNRGGAGGNIAAEMTAKAAPDGYTLMLGTPGILTVNPSLSQVRFDTLKDFTPVTIAANLTSILVVHPSLGVKTGKELIQYAKARPGQLNYGSSGNGSASHLAMEMFNRAAQVSMRHIPYKGAAPAANDLIAGTVQVLLIGLPTVMPHVATGRIVALGVPTATPSPLAPGIPTVADSAGLPGFEMSNWLGFVMPSATPRAIVTRLNTEIVSIVRLPDVKAQLLKAGIEPTGSSIEEMAAALDAGLKSWPRIVKEANIKID